MMMLEGLKVIEMSTYVAAPGAGGMLRDWGAEVIKVEPLTGCPMRSFFEGTKSKLEIIGNPIFSLDNRGKKGMTINTSNENYQNVIDTNRLNKSKENYHKAQCANAMNKT